MRVQLGECLAVHRRGAPVNYGSRAPFLCLANSATLRRAAVSFRLAGRAERNYQFAPCDGPQPHIDYSGPRRLDARGVVRRDWRAGDGHRYLGSPDDLAASGPRRSKSRMACSRTVPVCPSGSRCSLLCDMDWSCSSSRWARRHGAGGPCAWFRRIRGKHGRRRNAWPQA